MFDKWQRATEELTKSWEEAASGWWDRTLRSPHTLEAMGGMLPAMCSAKERWDQALDEAWSRWRLPSASDVDRIHERIGEIPGLFAEPIETY